jgi:hypothetical protein
MTATPPPQSIRPADADQSFSLVQLSDTCVDAANRAARRFDRSYPGWQLYSRVARGDTVFDRQLAAWAIWCARTYVRSRKLNGRAVVAPRGRRNDWIISAGLDALEFCINGEYDANAWVLSSGLGVDNAQYQRVRGVLAGMMVDGFENYRSELHYQYSRVRRDESLVKYFGTTVVNAKMPLMLGVRGIDFGLSANGCYITPPAGNPDNA